MSGLTSGDQEEVVLTYDRRAPEALMRALRPAGWASSLAEYGRSGQFALDLQLRGYSNKPGHWATLYVGLTKVLDLRYLPTRGFRLEVHPTWQVHGWDAGWGRYRQDGFTAAEWQCVENYLERVIPKVGVRFLIEGGVQSAVSGFQSRDLTVIDREVAVSFSSQAEKDHITQTLAKPLLTSIATGDPDWWKARPRRLGGECDALAIAADGSLLAIEIKPKKAASTIPWSPVQVRHYANILTEWARVTQNASEIVNDMVDQRVELALIRGRAPRCSSPIRVRPVVAIQRGMSATVLGRLRAVQQRLEEAELNQPPLELFEVNLVGRLDPLAL